MTKWTGELQDPPSWLDPTLEVTAAMEPPKLETGPFVVACLKALLGLGLTFDQAVGIAANTMNETGWGKYYRAYNLGGWKIFKFNSKNADGTPRHWWRALGNKSSGDPQTCFYMAFASIEAFFAAWVAWFVPKHSTGLYGATGALFWSGGDWFPAMIKAGYKGEVTKMHPEGSIAEHTNMEHALTTFWAQYVIGTDVDGKWGPKSQAALSAWQLARGLPDTKGVLDEATLHALTGNNGPQTVRAVLATPPSPPPATP